MQSLANEFSFKLRDLFIRIMNDISKNHINKWVSDGSIVGYNNYFNVGLSLVLHFRGALV